MKYKHFCHVDPQEPNITLVGLFIIQQQSLLAFPFNIGIATLKITIIIIHNITFLYIHKFVF